MLVFIFTLRESVFFGIQFFLCKEAVEYTSSCGLRHCVGLFIPWYRHVNLVLRFHDSYLNCLVIVILYKRLRPLMLKHFMFNIIDVCYNAHLVELYSLLIVHFLLSISFLFLNLIYLEWGLHSLRLSSVDNVMMVTFRKRTDQLV